MKQAPACIREGCFSILVKCSTWNNSLFRHGFNLCNACNNNRILLLYVLELRLIEEPPLFISAENCACKKIFGIHARLFRSIPDAAVQILLDFFRLHGASAPLLFSHFGHTCRPSGINAPQQTHVFCGCFRLHKQGLSGLVGSLCPHLEHCQNLNQPSFRSIHSMPAPPFLRFRSRL